jgi:hypothetical protein
LPSLSFILQSTLVFFVDMCGFLTPVQTWLPDAGHTIPSISHRYALMSANDSSPIELFNSGMCLLVLLYSLLFSGWQACKGKTGIWFWRACAVLILSGIAIALCSDHLAAVDAAEMPKEFSIGVVMMLTGIVFTLLGSLLKLSVILRRRHAAETH